MLSLPNLMSFFEFLCFEVVEAEVEETPAMACSGLLPVMRTLAGQMSLGSRTSLCTPERLASWYFI